MNLVEALSKCGDLVSRFFALSKDRDNDVDFLKLHLYSRERSVNEWNRRKDRTQKTTQHNSVVF